MKNFTQAIKEAVKENDLATNFVIDSNYSVRIDGREKFQIIHESKIDEIVDNRRNYDGFPCVSFEFKGTEYFFLKL